ncbi:MAG TPA: lytic transglycosylase domain-containing protein [Bryobacteraceae bacterium]|nr:lytic transglycosylase domain-containing protein [Bryobacteraceae bacterium]
MADDPFAQYHRSFETQLSAMLDRQQVRPREVPEAAPVQQTLPAPQKLYSELDLRSFAKRYWGGRDAEFAAAFARLQRLRPTLESILGAEGLPKELIAVVLVESGAQPLARSPRQARGLWQFIPETARRYGLAVSTAKDERVQLDSATRAAARYLRDLYGRFGSWPLALAAYNAGENAVQSALEKGRATTFSQLSSAGLLPAETRSYVPAVLAAMELLGTTRIDPPIPEMTQRDAWVFASTGVAN